MGISSKDRRRITEGATKEDFGGHKCPPTGRKRTRELSRQNRDTQWKGWRGGREKRKNYPTKKNIIVRIDPKKAQNVNKRPAKGFALCRRESDVRPERHKIPNAVFALTGRSLYRLLPMAMPCADCSMPLRDVVA